MACGWDNRLVDKYDGYTTTINGRGDIEWHPPPDLDHGQHRINYHHRPELLLPQQISAPPDRDDFDDALINIDLLWITEMTEALQSMEADHSDGGTGTRRTMTALPEPGGFQRTVDVGPEVDITGDLDQRGRDDGRRCARSSTTSPIVGRGPC